MRCVVASRIMRTTIDLDPTVLRELKHRSARSGKSMGQLASELLARSLDEGAGEPAASPLTWITRELGLPRVDLEDKEAVRAALDSTG
jgi:plasmid stability protein